MEKPVREATTSLWMDTANVSLHQKLAKDVETDICVVGAGIAGLTTAYLLAREGRRVIVIDDAQSMVRVIARLARFFAHESCAQCTQCREGTAWTTKILERIRDGQGTMEDLDTLISIANNMTGTTICVLSDSCATPVISGIIKFRPEFEALIHGKRIHSVMAAVA